MHHNVDFHIPHGMDHMVCVCVCEGGGDGWKGNSFMKVMGTC